ncbi:MAG: glutathione S-transferase family protein [Burkholderiaceae bacterium]
MKLYTSEAPNPFRVKVFLREKGIEIPTQMINIMDGETRQPDFLRINSLAEVPVLELNDGSYLTESVAICRFLETQHPTPALLGTSKLEVARVDMWNRRMEQQIMTPIGEVARHTFGLFADRFEQVQAYADTQMRLQLKRWAWLDQELADGRTYVCEDEFSIADITGMAALKICGYVGQDVPAELVHARRWEQAVKSRASWH